MARFSHYLFLWATLLSIFFHAPQVIAQNHSMDIEHRAATEIYSVEQLISERTLNPAPTVRAFPCLIESAGFANQLLSDSSYLPMEVGRYVASPFH
ncbi:MAG: hypothetical protein ACODTL_00170 [Brucella sp.]